MILTLAPTDCSERERPGHTRSGARMVAAVKFLHALTGHVRIYLCRRNVAMAQQQLNDAQIGAIIQ